MKKEGATFKEAIEHLNSGKVASIGGTRYKFGCGHYHYLGSDDRWHPAHMLSTESKWVLEYPIENKPEEKVLLLEEALVAMRNGRKAIWGGQKYRIDNNGKLLRLSRVRGWDSWIAFRSEDLRDFAHGWTLAPEDPPNWPKHSLQWAELEAKRLGRTHVMRRGSNLGSPANSFWASEGERHALDWVVVE